MAVVLNVVMIAVTLNWLTILVDAGPVNFAVSPFARNIRPIACKSSKNSMEEGICMFAMDCTRSNGYHLGMCVDRFYVGSCCANATLGPVLTMTTTTEATFSGSNDLGQVSSTSVTPGVTTVSSTTTEWLKPTENALGEGTTGSTSTVGTTTTTAAVTTATSTSSAPTTTEGSTTTTTMSTTTSTTEGSTEVVESSTTSQASTSTTSSPPSTTTTPAVQVSSVEVPESTEMTPEATEIPFGTDEPVTELEVEVTTTSFEEEVTETEPPQTDNKDSGDTVTSPGLEVVDESTVSTPTVSSTTTTTTTTTTTSPASIAASPISTVSVSPVETTTAAGTSSTAASASSTAASTSSTAASTSSTTSPTTSTTIEADTTVEETTMQSTTALPSVPAPNITTVAPTVSTNVTTDVPSLLPASNVTLNGTSLEGAAIQFQDYHQVCGRPKYQYPSARIVGGSTTHYGQWPWQISLRQWRTATFLHKCGAALLNENWAITAAHCVDNVQPDDLLLRMGEYDLATDEEEYPYVERKVQIVASHPQFDSRTFEYDLALLRFYDPVRFQPNIIPICLPDVEPEVDYVGRTAYVTGWGRLYEDGPLPSKMQQVSVPVIENTECENMYRRAGYVEHIPNIFICAGYSDGKRDSCEGDSGGPLVIQDNNIWKLIGVISWGIGCAEANQPGVYTRITEFREWIDKIIVF